MRELGRRLAFVAFLASYAPAALSATWVDVEVTCPVCGTLNVFKAPASYGTYVYYEPSRFQYVFWPSTTNKFLYTCRNCHLTAYMHDFEAIPDDKVGALASMLERDAAIEGVVVPYEEIPMMVRLPIAEKVYEVLGRDDVFWCEFRRIEGFHLAEAGLAQRAQQARERALALAEKLLLQETPTRKELLVIAASMQFYTGNPKEAEANLRDAEKLTYRSPELAPEQNDGLDRYLTELIGAFRDKLLADETLD